MNLTILDGLRRKSAELKELIEKNPLWGTIDYQKLLDKEKRKEELKIQIQEAEIKLDAAKSVKRLELAARKAVLISLDYLDGDRLTMKGEIAACISCVDELYMTEMLCANILLDIREEYIVALLSGFVVEQKVNHHSQIASKALKTPIKRIRRIGKRLQTTSVAAKLDTHVGDYTLIYRTELVDAVFEWCRGATFVQMNRIIGHKVMPGTIVRCMRQLDELLLQLTDAVDIMDDTHLAKKLTKCRGLIRRGIMFYNSLYT